MSRNPSAAHRHSRWAAFALLPVLVVGCGGGSDPEQPVVAAPATSGAAETGAKPPAEKPAKTGAEVPVEAAAEPAESSADDEPLPADLAALVAPPMADVARPTRIRMPRLGIDAAMDPLHLNAKRVLVPPKYGRAGWYAAGPEPGEAGRSVVAGHVDSKTGPDVFAALNRARKGDRILVQLADGSTVRFAVERVESHPQKDFPTARVYGGPKRRAELRLITCTGPYDRARGRYLDNLIVFATLIR